MPSLEPCEVMFYYISYARHLFVYQIKKRVLHACSCFIDFIKRIEEKR